MSMQTESERERKAAQCAACGVPNGQSLLGVRACEDLGLVKRINSENATLTLLIVFQESLKDMGNSRKSAEFHS